MSTETEPHRADSSTSATPGSEWKAGDSALTKPMSGGHIYMGAQTAEQLGIKEGVEGWTRAEVIEDAQ
jgi:hypothetical protein